MSAPAPLSVSFPKGRLELLKVQKKLLQHQQQEQEVPQRQGQLRQTAQLEMEGQKTAHRFQEPW